MSPHLGCVITYISAMTLGVIAACVLAMMCVYAFA